MTVSNNTLLSLELPSHFSHAALLCNSFSHSDAKAQKVYAKTFSEYSFEKSKTDKDLKLIDFYLLSKKLNGDKSKCSTLSCEAQDFGLDDLVDKNNLLQYLLIMQTGDPTYGFQMGYRPQSLSVFHKIEKLKFWECACHNAKRFEKSKEDLITRVVFELDIASKVSKAFKSKDEKITFLCLGSGGCLSEWKIFSQLILMGYNNLEIYLVDTAYEKKEDLESPQTFKTFFEEFPGLKANVQILTSLGDFAKEKIPCDVALALDFDCNSEFPAVELQLSDKGFSYITKKHDRLNWTWNDNSPKRHILFKGTFSL